VICRSTAKVGVCDIVLHALRQSSFAKFAQVSKEVQEDEHSLEMHLPYARLIGAEDCTIVPIMVGELNDQTAGEYAKLLHPYFNDKHTVFLVSSDFCHWGKRFDYTWYKKEDGAIHDSISKLDHEGMQHIENQSYQ
jgi:MEMO1 family protein